MLLRGQNSFIYQAVNDWNILSNEAKNISDILPFNETKTLAIICNL